MRHPKDFVEVSKRLTCTAMVDPNENTVFFQPDQANTPAEAFENGALRFGYHFYWTGISLFAHDAPEELEMGLVLGTRFNFAYASLDYMTLSTRAIFTEASSVKDVDTPGAHSVLKHDKVPMEVISLEAWRCELRHVDFSSPFSATFLLKGIDLPDDGEVGDVLPIQVESTGAEVEVAPIKVTLILHGLLMRLTDEAKAEVLKSTAGLLDR